MNKFINWLTYRETVEIYNGQSDTIGWRPTLLEISMPKRLLKAFGYKMVAGSKSFSKTDITDKSIDDILEYVGQHIDFDKNGPYLISNITSRGNIPCVYITLKEETSD